MILVVEPKQNKREVDGRHDKLPSGDTNIGARVTILQSINITEEKLVYKATHGTAEVRVGCQ